MTRIRVCGTVDSVVAIDFDNAVKDFQKKALERNVPVPTSSDLLQEVIKKGLVQVRKQNCVVQ